MYLQTAGNCGAQDSPTLLQLSLTRRKGGWRAIVTSSRNSVFMFGKKLMVGICITLRDPHFYSALHAAFSKLHS